MALKPGAEQNAELKTAAGGAWSTAEIVQKGITPPQLEHGRRRFQIAYWRDRFGGYHYPKWQFTRSMKVIPEVAQILGILRTHDTMRVLSWFVQPLAPRAKTLLGLIRTGRGKRALVIVREEERANASVPPLTRKDAAELRRRMKDFEDRSRFVIASCWGRRTASFYDVQRGYYILNEIDSACLFRRREHAEAVAKLLDEGRRRDRFRHRVVAAETTSRGPRLTESLADPFHPNKRVRPRLRASSVRKLPILVPIAPLTHPRAHVLESFLFACENRDALAALVANAPTRLAAEKRLMRETLMSQSQAAAVLELRFWHFTRNEHRKFLAELRLLLRA